MIDNKHVSKRKKLQTEIAVNDEHKIASENKFLHMDLFGV